MRLVRDLGGELRGEPRRADAGLAREQDDLAHAGPGLAQALAQQGALRHPPTRSVSPRRAASNRLSAAATPATMKASTGSVKPFTVWRPRSVSRNRSPI